jgi:hypothetical protein
MDEKERQSAFVSALTTEHFVLQSASSTTVTESAARASIYIMSLSSSLVAMGFASQSPEAFGPLVAAVVPALFLLGVFTVIRLVDVSGQYMHYRARMARLHRYYYSLSPDAPDYFAFDPGRWVDARSIPSLQSGPRIAFLTTTASMVAFINNVVAGAGLSLLARWLLGPRWTVLAVGIGAVGVVILMAAFLAYQKWRYSMFEPAFPQADSAQGAAGS